MQSIFPRNVWNCYAIPESRGHSFFLQKKEGAFQQRLNAQTRIHVRGDRSWCAKRKVAAKKRLDVQPKQKPGKDAKTMRLADQNTVQHTKNKSVI
jgi:hypothetical protein